ncbi:hypothetical protein LAZ40_07155 [Cereibacter sphaeroides]|uniref:hypothetical protein n=1 Tax=Cereibacter sphaeroides TaxID=1063 RepID=UPI001F2C777B|nr:hypothetical protein [Cereibacter sphaeroides]MCE6958825.1 hypothetical protein [Cereibacter sphaeroides]MCE6973301.1 hypothetical protein [Cereibacter sphaeroides]
MTIKKTGWVLRSRLTEAGDVALSVNGEPHSVLPRNGNGWKGVVPNVFGTGVPCLCWSRAGLAREIRRVNQEAAQVMARDASDPMRLVMVRPTTDDLHEMGLFSDGIRTVAVPVPAGDAQELQRVLRGNPAGMEALASRAVFLRGIAVVLDSGDAEGRDAFSRAGVRVVIRPDDAAPTP